MKQTQKLEELIVDSHQHFWNIDKLDYPWMPPGENILRRNYLPSDLAPILNINGISKTVLIQANQTIEEAGFLLDLAQSSDFIAGVVVWVDVTSQDVGKVLDELSQRDKLVGVRHQVHDELDDAWLCRDDVVRGLREISQRDLTYDLLLRPQHIKYVSSLAERVPDLRLVIDHIAKPFIASGLMEPWATDLAIIAAIPGIHCKISGMVTEADHSKWTASDLMPYVSHVVNLFGYSRLMWGSDWPACLPAASYGEVLNAAREAIGPISNKERNSLMGSNAINFYHL